MTSIGWSPRRLSGRLVIAVLSGLLAAAILPGAVAGSAVAGSATAGAQPAAALTT